MATESQRESYAALLGDKLGERQLAVFYTIRDYRYGMTLFEIAEKMNLPINQVSGRVSELQKLGFVQDSGGKRINPKTGKKGTVWTITDRFNTWL
jgi:predicted transcriptional regulator